MKSRSPSRRARPAPPGDPPPAAPTGRARTSEQPGPVLKKVRSYNPKADTKLLERAYRYAEEAHEGQFRLSGEPTSSTLWP